ncbi:Intraflagellar transport protein 52 -like protein [Halotydeus destructor]|nr:Intraflagellar transport protein 52 -like protein [Halotydeus destructor]
MVTQEQNGGLGSAKNTIGFDVSKSPLLTSSDGYRLWTRRLKTSGWKILNNKEEVSHDFLKQIEILIISSPRAKYSEAEFSNIRKYIQDGGKLLALCSDGGEKRTGNNLNFLLEEYGISVNNDCVIRTSYYKYFHPKEALVSNGILNRSIKQHLQNNRTLDHNREDANDSISGSGEPEMAYVYPYGATLNVQSPAVAVLSTGNLCYPLQRPTVAFYTKTGPPSGPNTKGGKLVVTGSAHLFHDNYLEKEDNNLLKDTIMSFLTTDDIKLDPIDAKDPEVSDYHSVPDMEMLAEQPFCCLQEGEDIPSDHMKLFQKKLYTINNETLPLVLMAYDEMQMDNGLLKLIKPQFDTPLPGLLPAVFPANLRLPPKPSLELFDLDHAFSSVQTRLLQVANKCSDDDIEYYVKECGQLVGITEVKASKDILYHLFTRIVEYKKVNVNGTDD